MKVLNDRYWKQTTWEDILKNHPGASVMKSGLDFERPLSWKKYDGLLPGGEDTAGSSIATRWGSNSKLGRPVKNDRP